MTVAGDVDMQVPHNLDVLPHLHDADAIDKLLPVLEAPPAGVNIEDWDPVEGERERLTGKCSSHGTLPGAGTRERHVRENMWRLDVPLAAW